MLHSYIYEIKSLHSNNSLYWLKKLKLDEHVLNVIKKELSEHWGEDIWCAEKSWIEICVENRLSYCKTYRWSFNGRCGYKTIDSLWQQYFSEIFQPKWNNIFEKHKLINAKICPKKKNTQSYGKKLVQFLYIRCVEYFREWNYCWKFLPTCFRNMLSILSLFFYLLVKNLCKNISRREKNTASLW